MNISKGGYPKLYQKHIPNSIGAKLVCIDNRFAIKEFIKLVFEQKKYCNKIINDHFNKKLKMTIEYEDNYQNSQNFGFC